MFDLSWLDFADLIYDVGRVSQLVGDTTVTVIRSTTEVGYTVSWQSPQVYHAEFFGDFGRMVACIEGLGARPIGWTPEPDLALH